MCVSLIEMFFLLNENRKPSETKIPLRDAKVRLSFKWMLISLNVVRFVKQRHLWV